jgi:excisionase family DNA binding protein
MGSSRKRWNQDKDQGKTWDEWQKYIKRETQRLRQKSSGNVVEVTFSSGQRTQLSEAPKQQVETETPKETEGRRPPVPGVPREEALQVSDDKIGSTVKPFSVNDYKNIRPLNSPDLFESDDTSVQEEIQDVPEEIDPGEFSPVEAVSRNVQPLETRTGEEAGPIPVGGETEIPPVDVDTQPAPEEVAKAKGKKKKGGKKKKAGTDGELELFGSVSEHQVISRQRLTKKSRIDREELIEKLLDPVISLEEAATLIGVCKTTVRRYTNNNQLECLRTPGQQRRFKLSHVLEFVKKREEEQKSRRGRKSGE